MTIGELLKEKRLAATKTQKEWVGQIISPSFYAKVEKKPPPACGGRFVSYS